MVPKIHGYKENSLPITFLEKCFLVDKPRILKDTKSRVNIKFEFYSAENVNRSSSSKHNGFSQVIRN